MTTIGRTLGSGTFQILFKGFTLQPDGYHAFLVGPSGPVAPKHHPQKVGFDPGHAGGVIARASFKGSMLADILCYRWMEGLIDDNAVVVVLCEDVLATSRPDISRLVFIRFLFPNLGW
jgi:hypothetical protein